MANEAAGQSSNSGAGQGSASSGSSDVPAQGAGAAVAARSGSDTAGSRAEKSALVDRLLAKYHTAERALEALAGENYDYREAARKDADTIATLTASQKPKDAVILVGDEKAQFEKIKAAGVPLDKVPEQLTRAKTLGEEAEKRTRAEKVGAVAKAAQMDGEVLAPLLEQFGYEVDTRIVKVQNGTKVDDVPEAIIRKAGDDKAPWGKLSDEVAKAESPFSKFAIALKAKPGNGQQQQGNTGGGSTTPQGGASTFAFPAGGGGGASQGGGGDPAADFLAKRNAAAAARPNPFAPPPAANTQAK